MFLVRWILGMPMAALITAGLFFMMAQLIKDRGEELPPPKPSLQLRITAEPPPSESTPVKPPREVLKKTPPETKLDFPPVDRKGGTPVDPGPFEVERIPPTDGGVIAGPTIKVPPAYPESCRSRGITGSVIVEFDVTPEGNVVKPRVVQTPNACFNRTVIKAVSGWKYPPAANGGMRYGVIERFNFQLEE